MKIFSKKAFAIGEGAKRNSDIIDLFVTVPLSFQEMPDKYADDPTFKLAVAAGEITIVNGNEEKVKAIENGEFADVPEEVPVMSETEAFYEELKGMNREETLTLAEKYNVTFNNNDKLGQIKKRVFEAYKLNK